MTRQSDNIRAAAYAATAPVKSATPAKIDEPTLLKALEKSENNGKLLKVPRRFVKSVANIRSKIEKNEAFEALKESIREYGFLNPIVVSKIGDKVSVVSGHRRLMAAEELNLVEIPVILKVYTDERDRTVEQVIENVVRENLQPIDFAQAILKIKMSERVSAEKIAVLIGQKDRKYVERLCKIAKWEQPAKDLANELNLSLFQLMNIAKQGDAQGQQLLDYLKGTTPTIRQGASIAESKNHKKIEHWFMQNKLDKKSQKKFTSIAKSYEILNPKAKSLLFDFLKTLD